MSTLPRRPHRSRPTSLPKQYKPKTERDSSSASSSSSSSSSDGSMRHGAKFSLEKNPPTKRTTFKHKQPTTDSNVRQHRTDVPRSSEDARRKNSLQRRHGDGRHISPQNSHNAKTSFHQHKSNKDKRQDAAETSDSCSSSSDSNLSNKKYSKSDRVRAERNKPRPVSPLGKSSNTKVPYFADSAREQDRIRRRYGTSIDLDNEPRATTSSGRNKHRRSRSISPQHRRSRTRSPAHRYHNSKSNRRSRSSECESDRHRTSSSTHKRRSRNRQYSRSPDRHRDRDRGQDTISRRRSPERWPEERMVIMPMYIAPPYGMNPGHMMGPPFMHPDMYPMQHRVRMLVRPPNFMLEPPHRMPRYGFPMPFPRQPYYR